MHFSCEWICKASSVDQCMCRLGTSFCSCEGECRGGRSLKLHHMTFFEQPNVISLSYNIIFYCIIYHNRLMTFRLNVMFSVGHTYADKGILPFRTPIWIHDNLPSAHCYFEWQLSGPLLLQNVTSKVSVKSARCVVINETLKSLFVNEQLGEMLLI